MGENKGTIMPRTHKPRPNQKHTRKRKQPRSLGGKFASFRMYSPRELEESALRLPNGCLVRREESDVGHLDGNVWIVRQALNEERVDRRAHEIIWEWYTGKKGRKLVRTCKTNGCINWKHFEERQVGEEKMINDTQARLLYDNAQAKGEIRLHLGDEKKAHRMRMSIYTLRSKWKKIDPFYFSAISDFELVIEGGDLICRKRGMAFDDLFSGLEQIRTEELSIEYLEAKPMDELPEAYRPKKKLINESQAPAFDLDNPPSPSDPSYEAFVTWATNPANVRKKSDDN